MSMIQSNINRQEYFQIMRISCLAGQAGIRQIKKQIKYE